MKSLTNIILFIVTVLCAQRCHAVAFSTSVMRLQAPVLIQDVLDLGSHQHLATQHWPEQLHGWVDKLSVVKLLRQHGVTLSQDAWHGPKKVWLEWCYPADEEVMRTSAVAFLSKQLAASGVTLMSLTSVSNSTKVCTKTPVSDYQWLNWQVLPGRNIKLQASLQLAQAEPVNRRFNLRFLAMADIAHLAEDVAKNTPLTRANIVYQSTAWTGTEVLRGQAVSEYLANKGLAKSTRLSWEDLKLITDVIAGQSIKVALRHGAVNIETKGRALTEGRIGQVIQVRIDGSNKTSEATVVAKGEVNVSV